MSRIRVGVLFGGPSAEHEVSCASALAVVRALDPRRFEPVAVGVTRAGGFVLVPEGELVRLRQQPGGARAIEDRLAATGEEVDLRSGRPAPVAVLTPAGAPEKVLAELDVVFPVLHGTFGEDGVVQGLLETVGVPYVGCGVLASAVGMDKVAMKRAFVADGLPVPPYVWFDAAAWEAGGPERVAQLRHPVFVKPARMGSSIGISRVADGDDLAAAVAAAFRYGDTVLVEQGIPARELECGVLGGSGAGPLASVVGEVTVTGGWFDYQQKYFGDADPMVVPARLPAAVATEVQELSIRAFQAVGGWGLSRVDFLYDEAAGRVYLNELNTMPGFTAHSMYPKVWAATGVPYPELIARLITLAFQRHARHREVAR